MNNNQQLNKFTYPCLIGQQGGRRVLTISVTFTELFRVLAVNRQQHTLERSQRVLNQKRATAFADYLVNALSTKSDYIIPPLIGNIDGEIIVEPSPQFPGFGTVTIPMSSKIDLFDGQHRNFGILETCELLCNLDTQTVTVELTENLPCAVRQQFFADINGNASKPNAAINLAYDRTNILSQMVREMVESNDVLFRVTDFERTNITGKTPYWVSFKAFCDASGRFIRVSDDSDRVQQQNDLRAIWEAWCEFTGLSDALVSGYGEYVQEWLTFTAVMVNAFGFAVQELLENMTVLSLCQRLKDMAAQTSRRERDDFFLYSQWQGLCVSKETGKIMANIRGQRAAATRLVSAIKSGTFVEHTQA
ncbi:DGQHR domain-containing protein [Salmonella enterica]|uniref:DGQHR domain-containing protein n=1 Tax=Salmonella enterica TaxID=28901 RepID=UPI001603D320|nr:DGQHR domain-containing protein [Salmonella enterica]EBG5498726.1 DGQHR domain-containing protein [Salmonella enterica subsp. enterica serovar Lagos]EGP2905192.1 DGQHR domain-containing protein [Salmonella enterica subsp. enterica serovar Muenster]EHX6837168.1 DGQHR domain-containing protein [Salmonella enterica subsp. enterica serovar Muenster]